MNPTQLQDALDRVDLSAIPDRQARSLYDAETDDLLLSAIEHLYTAYVITRSGDRFHSETAEVFHDSAIEKIAIALHLRGKRADRFSYDREDVTDPNTVDPAGIDGFALGRWAK